MTSTSTPTWDGIPTPVPLHEPASIGTIVVGAFLSVITLGVFLVLALWDLYSRAYALDREGIRCHRGLLRWSELADASVVTHHGGRVGHLTSVSFFRMQFPTRTIDIGPWGAPDPELVLRALSAGTRKHVDVPRPRGVG